MTRDPKTNKQAASITPRGCDPREALTPMSDPFLKIETDGPVMTVTMNSPDTRNALSYNDQFGEFVELADRINEDMAVRVVILTGAGSAFCAGGNVKQMRDGEGIFAGPPAAIRRHYKYGIQTIPMALHAVEVPMIAAVNGPAIGAGCDLTCMCDMRIASEAAKFGEVFVKLGIIPGDGGAWLIQKVVGYANAALMSFTGDVIDAAEALRIGLVNKVVPADQLLTEARDLADRIAANPPHALRMTKKLMREAQLARLDTVLELSAAYQALSHTTADHKEAIDAMFEKRAGVYTGS